MLYCIFDGVPLPFDPQPSPELLGPTQFESLFGFVVLYVFLLTLISFVLPRPWFVALARIAFPFMPATVQSDDE